MKITGLASINNTLVVVMINYIQSIQILELQLISSDRFGVNERYPTGLASIGDTLYMVGDDNDKLYSN